MRKWTQRVCIYSVLFLLYLVNLNASTHVDFTNKENVNSPQMPDNAGCNRLSDVVGDIHVACYNISLLPFTGNIEKGQRTRTVFIERSKITLPDLHVIYPNVMNIRIDNCRLEGGIKASTFQNLTSLTKLTIYWSTLPLREFTRVLCSLTSNPVDVYFIGIFPDDNYVRFTESSLACLKSSSISLLDFTSNAIISSSAQVLICAVGPATRSLRVGKVLSLRPIILEKNYFKCLQHVRTLQNLELASTWVEGIGKDSFQHLSHLQSLDLYNAASKTSLVPFDPLDNLTNLNLGENTYREFKMFSHAAQNVSLNQLKRLNLEKNSFPIFYAFLSNTFPSLEMLTLSNIHPVIQNIPDDFIMNLNSLKTLDLSNTRIGYISEKAFRSTSLQELNLNRVVIRLGRVPLPIFSHASALTNLTIDHLNMEYPRPGHYGPLTRFCRYALQNLPTLQHLSLRYAGFNVIYDDMFHKTDNLKTLNLANNQIEAIMADSLYKLSSMLTINLNSNLLLRINSTMLPNTEHALIVSVSYNPLYCDCRLYEFRQWLDNNTHIQLDPSRKNSYTCKYGAGSNDLRVMDYNPTYNDCFSNNLSREYAITVIATLSTILLALVVSIVVRFRWHLYYCYIRARASGKQYQELLDMTTYKYDAFVSYNRNDTSWVVHTLRHVLESKHNLKLCLHDRDWLGGVDIVDNIIASIEKSRKVVLVVTNSFAASNWCQLELTMAQHRIFSKDRNNLVLIMKEDIADVLMTPRLALQMREKTYIGWDESEMGEIVFWERLVRAIKGPVSSVRQAIPTCQHD